MYILIRSTIIFLLFIFFPVKVVKWKVNFCFFLIFQFKANEDVEGKNISLHGTWAHYIRIHPVGYRGTSPCLRIALYGCDSGNKLLLVTVASVTYIRKSTVFMCVKRKK